MATKITKEITLDLLTEKSVSVKTVEKATVNLQERVLDTYRKAYANSPNGRQQIVDELPEQWAKVVLTAWGDTPTVADPPTPEESEDK